MPRCDSSADQMARLQKIDFNGYPRYIISCNPPRIDQDGDIVDEDEDESFQPSTAENDPYCDIRVEGSQKASHSSRQADKC